MMNSESPTAAAITKANATLAVASPAAKKAKPVARSKSAIQGVAKAAVKPAQKPSPRPSPKPKAKPAAKAAKPAEVRAKVAAKPRPKPVAKPVAKAKPVVGKTAPKSKAAAAPKAKAKLVRDSFTMPLVDFALIDALKQRALAFKQPLKKSELLRAGLHALMKLTDVQLRAIVATLATLKPGRPKKGD